MDEYLGGVRPKPMAVFSTSTRSFSGFHYNSLMIGEFTANHHQMHQSRYVHS